MNLKQQKCPNCGAPLQKGLLENANSLFCPYCGEKISIDDQKSEYTFNKNVNVVKTTHHKYTDEVELLKEKNEYIRNKIGWIMGFAGMLFFVMLIVFGIVFLANSEKSKSKEIEEKGLICAGYSGDLLGEDCASVEAHFKAAGFINIELIELNPGIAFWKKGEVESISIGGNTSFDSGDHFSPDTKVIISYYTK